MKIHRIKIGFVALTLCAFISCKDEENKATEASSQTESEAAAKTANSEVKVNPAHGLPGHRCDLPVGAPLNGTASTPQTNTTQQVQSSSTVSPIRVDQTPKVNPPHGEPGHDCAKPVGAKLDN